MIKYQGACKNNQGLGEEGRIRGSTYGLGDRRSFGATRDGLRERYLNEAQSNIDVKSSCRF